MELDKIVCMDALEYMRGLEDASVDMVLTDPPYNTTACDWDVALPLEDLWVEIKRVIKQVGVIAITATQPFTSLIVCSNLSWFRYEWIWVKNRKTNFLNVKTMPLRRHESVLIFSPTSPANYYPIMTPSQMRLTGSLQHRGTDVYGTFTDYQVMRDEYYPDSVLEISIDGDLSVTYRQNSMKQKRHPTQKPLALMRYFVETYTQPGDIVLDPFMGSGTTALAAKLTGRHYLGCDLSQQYVDIANARLADMPQDKTLQNGDVQLSLFGD